MSDWILVGALEEHAPTPDPSMAGNKDGDFSDRKQIVLKILSQTKLTYDDLFEKEYKRNDLNSVSKAYELKDQVITALDELQLFISQLENDFSR